MSTSYNVYYVNLSILEEYGLTYDSPLSYANSKFHCG
jgi:hypothetical protein